VTSNILLNSEKSIRPSIEDKISILPEDNGACPTALSILERRSIARPFEGHDLEPFSFDLEALTMKLLDD
jgi:hypothetical protein